MEKVIEEIQQAIKALTPITQTTPIGAEQIIDARYSLGKALNEALKISCNPVLSEVPPSDQYRDTEADGITFCGKCGSMKAW